MHEFLLFSQIPESRHNQVLSILAGATRSQPVKVQEQTVLLHPLKLQQTTVSSKKIRQQQQSQPQAYAHNLIRPLSSQQGDSIAHSPWRLYIPEIPDPGVRTLVSRGATEVYLNDVDRFKDASSSFTLKTQYMTDGLRFVHRNIIVRVFRIVMPPEQMETVLDQPPPTSFEGCTVLDPSGAYLVEACVRVEDRTNSALTEKATAELLEFQKLMEGAIDLRVVDRLALDTRVKIT
ncbi:hypothetical protein K431DRAFT_322305 [Polychaeton citri CBS 116435]|uniref:Mediator of RNA polymerase II transcription subunit 18 n=1 Tax=Polychaeton citri CBS 116435 TaxID=1314669 RepID=A0A9P4Q315_9PEZI|nr:hypothetical protein K431DRAFT_322305 [Polychaeton citri CBS 116435]